MGRGAVNSHQAPVAYDRQHCFRSRSNANFYGILFDRAQLRDHATTVLLDRLMRDGI